MSEFKGTKGPWVVWKGFVLGEEGEKVAMVENNLDSIEDLNLIAAAPELLEALMDLFENYQALSDSGDAGNWSLEETAVGKKAKAAIAKALGEE